MNNITKAEAEVALVKLFLNAELEPDLPEEHEDDIPTLLRNVQTKMRHLKRSLRKYGTHTQYCFRNVSAATKCNCGFDDIIHEADHD